VAKPALPAGLRLRAPGSIIDEVHVVTALGMELAPDSEQAFDLQPGCVRKHLLLGLDLEHPVGEPLCNTLAPAQELEQLVADLTLGESDPHLPLS
jgi:hypothetical protein